MVGVKGFLMGYWIPSQSVQYRFSITIFSHYVYYFSLCLLLLRVLHSFSVASGEHQGRDRVPSMVFLFVVFHTTM